MSKFLMQAVSSGIGGDGTLKRWNAGTLDFAATGFPGPGTAAHVACSKQIRDDVLLTVGNGTELGRRIEWDGTIWVQKRGWITFAVDYAGVSDADTAIRSTLASARTGQCCEFGDGQVKIAHATKITVPAGVTVTGSERGMRTGPFNVGGLTQVGTQFVIPQLSAGVGRGDLFELSVYSRLANVSFYYPNQNTNAAPIVYGWSVLMPNLGCNIENVHTVNSYEFIKVGAGCKISTVTGYPLKTGLWFARCSGTVHMPDGEWNPSELAAFGTTTTLQAWVAANATAIVWDGPESACIGSFFAYGYKYGIDFFDRDGDGFRGSSGDMFGQGFDGTLYPLHVSSSHGLSSAGFKGFGLDLVSYGGNAVFFEDNQVPGSAVAVPRIELHSPIGNAPPSPGNMINFVRLASTSRGICKVFGGESLGTPAILLNNLSTNGGRIRARGLDAESGVVRTGGPGSIIDMDGEVIL